MPPHLRLPKYLAIFIFICYFNSNRNRTVREYWIIDPAKEKVVVYYYDRDSDPCLYSFDSDIPVGIYPGLSIKINDLLKNH